MNHINEHLLQKVFKVSAATCTQFQTVAQLVKPSIANVLFKVRPSLHQAFLQVTDAMNICFVHALLHNTPIRHMILVGATLRGC